MINIKPLIYNKLKECTSNVTNDYPSDWTIFPCIQYTEEENSTYLKTDGVEQMAEVRFRIDIWDKHSTSGMAMAVDVSLTSLGLIRTSSVDITDPSGLRHKVMRYEGIVDVSDLKIYN